MATDQDKRRQIAEADQDKRRQELVAEALTFTIEAYSRMRGRSQPDTTLAELKTLLGEMSDVPVIVALQKYAEVRVDSLEGQSAETIEQMKARILERSKLPRPPRRTHETLNAQKAAHNATIHGALKNTVAKRRACRSARTPYPKGISFDAPPK